MASGHCQVKGRLPMRITVVDVLKCGFFSTLKTDKLPLLWLRDNLGWEDWDLQNSGKIWKKNDSNPNLCHCASRSGIVKNEKLSSIFILQKKTHSPNKFFAHWPRVCIVLQENLHQSRVPLLCHLVQDRVPLAVQKFFPEKLRGQNSTDFQELWRGLRTTKIRNKPHKLCSLCRTCNFVRLQSSGF